MISENSKSVNSNLKNAYFKTKKPYENGFLKLITEKISDVNIYF